ncbi:hypothetical protein F5Y15DRAFT_239681 [Xylariaceae sp. FL0016]|nr:hypothetical protein F5Y15DRAFT_239681 [Xylariaceae sp. FL0016]
MIMSWPSLPQLIRLPLHLRTHTFLRRTSPASRCHDLGYRRDSNGSRYDSRRFIATISEGGIDVDALKAEMLSRPPQYHYDTMHWEPSDLLNLALSDFIPGNWLPTLIHPSRVDRDLLADDQRAQPVPPGHHLLYFNTRVPGTALCADGTDPYHSPDPTGPFSRRMWAGGSLRNLQALSLRRQRRVCVERMTDVTVRGSPGAEKIYVEVSRDYIDEEQLSRLKTSLDSQALEKLDSHLKEQRTLVFMREMSDKMKKESLAADRTGPGRTSQAATPRSIIRHTMTPTRTLLFQYSALTYNAHAIHLDRHHAQHVEGLPDILVHGPLSLTLLLTALGPQLYKPIIPNRMPSSKDSETREYIHSINYRHLAPLFVGEPLTLCVAPKISRQASDTDGWATCTDPPDAGEILSKKSPENGFGLLKGDGIRVNYRTWDLWIEDKNGRLAVKAKAETRQQIPPGWSDTQLKSHREVQRKRRRNDAQMMPDA